MTRKARFLLTIVVGGPVLLVGVATHYLTREGPHLQALRVEPMATFVPAGATEAYRHDDRGGGIEILGPTSEAAIQRRITSCDRACYESFVARAEESGWRVTNRGPTSSVLERKIAAGRLSLVVREHDATDPSAVGTELRFLNPKE
jgi:hypothetical protein